MGRRTALLLLGLLSSTLTPAAGQERSLAIGQWTGCFQLAPDTGQSACGVIVLDSSPACGGLTHASYEIPFDTLEMPGEAKIPNQGRFSWHPVFPGQVEFASPPTEAENPDGESICVLDAIYFMAKGFLEGDSISGSWDWGGSETKRIGGTFTLKRSR
jgi:hypothetical protein